MEKLAVVVLAAGLGKRMGSPNPKVITQAGDRTLVEHVLSTVDGLNPEKTVVVIGHKGELVKDVVLKGAEKGFYSSNINFAIQEKMLGTGDAVKSAMPYLEDFVGTVFILCGDTPLIQTESLKALLKTHNDKKATITILSMRVLEENAYGRIVRDNQDNVTKIVEFKDCNEQEKTITEANSGIYAVDSAFLKPALENLNNNNAQGEYYLTDIIEQAVREGQTVAASLREDALEFQGVNTPADLAVVQAELEKRMGS